MQNTIFYVDAHSTLGAVRDYANARSSETPTLVRGIEACLKMRLFARSSGTEPYPVSALANIVSWQWAMDDDCNETTKYKLVGDNEDITVSSVTETVEGEEITYTEISIPMTQMNTQELSDWLGTEKSKSGLNGELVGIDVNGKQIFVLQIENFTIRNRITSLGNPTEIAPEYLTAAQVKALFAAGMECEFSSDGLSWHTTQTDSDSYVHFRLRGEIEGIWSDPVRLISGPQGEIGQDCYTYVAYASDNQGADFSITPSGSLKYRAEIHVQTAIPSPKAEDFAGAVWVKYIGDDGTGVGDMLKSVYDPDNDGKVVSSENADHAASADSVPWDGVTDKPQSYNPSTHTHDIGDIANPLKQPMTSSENPKTLYLAVPVLRNTADSGNAVNLEFTAIKTREDGSAYSITEDELLTWEYHVLSSETVTDITFGSEKCTMVGVNIPDKLELINGNPTYHVFVIRGIYKYNAVNNCCFQANYAYSYEA